ncbi:MAG: hypothetical protein DHS20C08_11850 [Rhodomicrobium sp.]|nr:MAG: hypothetical protein DHS20C08_11850 [Rhodomicrobium sp.]
MTGKVEQLSRHCLNYRTSDATQAVIQLITTFIPFLLLCVAMYQSLELSYALTLLLAVPTAGLTIRIFIMQHDCGHGSFFASNKANDWTGRILSVFTITPYNYWRRLHALHHASSSNLDKRGYGDIDTLTVSEYQARGFWGRLGYRIYRNPLFLMFIGGPLHFALLQRLPLAFKKPSLSMWLSVMGLNLSMVIVYGALIAYIGAADFFKLAIPVAMLSSAIGIWLFYIQHQFEDTHWAHEDEWDRKSAALYGSSYYRLPKLLQWFTGNIGIHHVHHLCSAIPNYRLQECLDDEPELKTINILTIRESLAYANLSLWDEESKKLVPFSALA